MNKQIVFFIIASIAGLGMIGVFVLLLIRPDASATLVNFLFQLLAVLGGFGGLAVGLAQQNKEIATIKTNTNGTLSKLQDENATLRSKLAEHAPQVLVEVETGPIDVSDKLRRDL